MTVLATTLSITESVVTLLAQVVGLAIIAATGALLATVAYRWLAREPIPPALALLIGLSGVAVYLNTTTILGELIGGADTVAQEALFNIGAFVAGAGGASLGRRVGDVLAEASIGTTGVRTVDGGVGRLVRAVGRVVTVDLPDAIDDVVGYDPVSPETKTALAGRTYVFPRGLTVDDLHDRLVARLKTDHRIGHVDLELDADGAVRHLGVARRPAGIGPTLPPGTNAVAVRADPAFAASQGDIVQVWDDKRLEELCTAELRGVSGDVVTLAVDASDAPSLDPLSDYRLVTQPVEDRPDRDFADLLRAADETFGSITVASGSGLDGITVGAIDATIAAVTSAAGETAILPDPGYVLGGGDTLHAIARPETLRRIDAAGGTDDPRPDPSLP